MICVLHSGDFFVLSFINRGNMYVHTGTKNYLSDTLEWLQYAINEVYQKLCL